MDLHLTRLKEMHPLLAHSTANEYAYRAAVGLSRHNHVPGRSISILISDTPHEGRLHWSPAGHRDALQLDYNQVTEDSAEAISLALVAVAYEWKVRRRLQRGESADWLLTDRHNNLVALEISGIDQIDVGTARLRQKLDQVRRCKVTQHRAASVVELQPPRSRVTNVYDHHGH